MGLLTTHAMLPVSRFPALLAASAGAQNNCEVFHICYPLTDETGRITEYLKWSFFCGNGTVFDQEALVCNHPEDAFPCEESPSLYGQIQYGRVDTEEYSEYSEY